MANVNKINKNQKNKNNNSYAFKLYTNDCVFTNIFMS